MNAPRTTFNTGLTFDNLSWTSSFWVYRLRILRSSSVQLINEIGQTLETPTVVLEVILLLAGVILAVVGHQTARMQVRAIGAALAAFGAVSLLLPILFG